MNSGPNPPTGVEAFVRVKAKAGQAVLDDYVDRFRRSGTYQRVFFVCHGPKGALSADGEARLHVWAGDRLADAAVGAGLFDWLTERSALAGEIPADFVHVRGLMACQRNLG